MACDATDATDDKPVKVIRVPKIGQSLSKQPVLAYLRASATLANQLPAPINADSNFWFASCATCDNEEMIKNVRQSGQCGAHLAVNCPSRLERPDEKWLDRRVCGSHQNNHQKRRAPVIYNVNLAHLIMNAILTSCTPNTRHSVWLNRMVRFVKSGE